MSCAVVGSYGILTIEAELSRTEPNFELGLELLFPAVFRLFLFFFLTASSGSECGSFMGIP